MFWGRLHRRSFDAFAEFVREVEGSLGLPGGFPHLVTDLSEGIAAVVVEELLEGDVDGANNGGSGEGSVRDELDLEGKTVLLNQRLVDGEFHWEVPCGACSAVFVDVGGGALGVVGVAGDRNDGVHVHLGEQVNIFEILCGYDVEF